MFTPANSNRPTRSALSRALTCIEARDEGYSFVNTCSHCDYYSANRCLNNKAMSRPRSELSKMWQCTMPHKLGDLYHSATHNTPYDETPINYRNSFLISSSYASAKSSGITSTAQSSESITRSQGSSKRPRTDVEKDLEHAVNDCNQLRQERDEAVNDCNRLWQERDEALKACNQLRQERDEAVDNCDILRQENMKAEKELEKYIQDIAAKQAELLFMREELERSIDGRDTATRIGNAISLDSSRMKILLDDCTEKVRTLTA